MSDNVESGMTFIRPPEGFFNVEKSQTMEGIGKGVKICEFFMRIEHGSKVRLFLVEAKSSSPKPPAIGGGPIPWDDYNDDICEKLTNGLLVYLGLKTGRPYAKRSELPGAMATDKIADVSIIPCLVLRDHPENALAPVQDELRIRLNHIVKSFQLEQPLAINRETAEALSKQRTSRHQSSSLMGSWFPWTRRDREIVYSRRQNPREYLLSDPVDRPLPLFHVFKDGLYAAFRRGSIRY